MRPVVRVDVDGLVELNRDLRAVDPMWPRQLRTANKDAAEIVAKEARNRAPVLTGRLRASIKAQASTRGAAVKAGTESRVPYAAPIEFGWRAHNIEAQPFLYPAIEAKNDDMRETYADEIDALLRRVFPF